VQLTDYVSLGFAPTVSVANLSIDPATFVAPNDASGDGIFSYPSGTNGRLRWGLGFQAGIFVTTDTCWDFGFSIKSPQWFETFEFEAADELGFPQQVALDVDFPMILSFGTAYHGFERMLVAMDIRFVDFDNTEGLGHAAGFDANAAVTGFGWKSVVAVALGAQYEVSECLTWRSGYLFADNPIPDEAATFNVASSAIYQHAVFLGGSWALTDVMTLSVAYYHAFDANIRGPLVTPLGAIPDSFVNIDQEIDALVAGIHVDF
jgi:long-chain fatty acid transport protein